MSLLSRAFSWRYRLPPAHTGHVPVDWDVRIPMRDGTILLADRHGVPGAPVILVRTPYGRRGPTRLLCRIFAERGFQVLVQSVRGTFGSGGEFDPFVNERPDGLDTVGWLVKQPWYGGKLATWGASYLGYTQRAIADAPQIMAMGSQVTTSTFEDHFYLGGAFALDDALHWAVGTALLERPLALLRPNPAHQHMNELPLEELDRRALGHHVAFYQGWLEHDPVYWAAQDHRDVLPAAPMHMTSGWYDLFLPQLLRDYAQLRDAGRRPYLTVGPWSHGSAGLLVVSIHESLRWFRAHLLGESAALRELPVRVEVTGGGGWRDLPDWPPPSTELRLHPAEHGTLSQTPGQGSARYRYDPADPTPSIGSPTLREKGLPVDNRPLESRQDVLVFSGRPLDADLELMGAPRAELRVRSSREHTDFFVRLCDVDSRGLSMNVTEGFVRCEPGRFPIDEDGVTHVTIPLRELAHRFARGHRIRFQVSSGAHPRLSRNPGTGAPLGTAVHLHAAEQEVLHASCFVLPVSS